MLSQQERPQAVMPTRITAVEAKYVEPFDENDHRPIDEASAKEIGVRLKELRKKYLDISSQEVFGVGVGVSRGAVANWEIGKGISRVNLYRVARIYDISFVWLSTGKGEPRGGNTPGEELPDLLKQSGLNKAEQEELVDEFKAILGLRIKHRGGGGRGNGPDSND